MKTYRVTITEKAESQIQNCLEYLLYAFQNEQAYDAVKADYEETLQRLETEAGSLRICDNPRLAKRQLRKIFFKKHDYVILYRLRGDTAEIIEIHHMLEDYENNIS